MYVTHLYFTLYLLYDAVLTYLYYVLKCSSQDFLFILRPVIDRSGADKPRPFPRSRHARFRGIRVNAISPGYTATPMSLRPELADQVKQFKADTPMGRMASVDELVGPAVFLSSQAASFCTGIDLIVDGGFICW